MRPKRSLAALALAAGVMLSAAVPVAIAAPGSPVGGRIDLIAGGDNQEYPAGTAFDIRHGLSLFAGDDGALGRSLFTLEVDGQTQTPSYTRHHVIEPNLVGLVWVFNFPAGMTGVHTFTGHWFIACGIAPVGDPTADPYVPCDGSLPTTPVEFATSYVTVTFIDE